MTERPILFSGPMVRAILAGIKTQTRRLATNKNAQKIKVGDTLWVRETFCNQCKGVVCYKASSEKMPLCCPVQRVLKPSIHLPRKYCRILLKVKSVRTEKLQDISEQDAKAEGVSIFKMSFMRGYGIFTEKFKDLWNHINTTDGTRWDDNPGVIVIEFERMEP